MMTDHDPWYAFVSLWKLIAYFYPLLLLDNTSKKYLKSRYGLSTETLLIIWHIIIGIFIRSFYSILSVT
jgi:hypothetical protein